MNTRWFTEAAVEEIRRDYETRIESLEHMLDQTRHTLRLRTMAMHRVLKRRADWQ